MGFRYEVEKRERRAEREEYSAIRCAFPREPGYPSSDILDLRLQLRVSILPEIHKPIIVFNCVFPVPAFFI